MPTVPEYTRKVAPTDLPGVRLNNNGGIAGGFGGNVWGQVTQLGGELQKQQEQNDVSAVLNASTGFSQELMDYYNGENGAFTKKGVNANGLFEQSKQFTNDLIDKYAANLSQKQALAFRQHNRINAFNYLRDVSTYERNQLSDVRKQTLANSLTTGNQAAVANWQNLPTADGFLLNNEQQIAASGSVEGWTPEMINTEKVKQTTAGVKGMFQSAIDNQDYTQAGNILKTYQKRIDPLTYETLNKGLAKIQQSTQNYKIVSDIVSKYTRPDGSPDIAGAMAEFDNLYGPNSVKTKSPSILSPDQLSFSKGDNPDWKDVPYKDKIGVSRIWRTLQGVDSGVQITSGYRDAERNAAAGGVDGSNHTNPETGAVDFGFSRDLSQDEKTAIAQQAKADGWQEVLWHDAGSGYHLHLGDYQGDTGEQTASNFNPENYGKMRQILNSKLTDAKTAFNDKTKTYRKGITQQVLSANSLEEVQGILDNADPDLLPLSDQNTLLKKSQIKYGKAAKGTMDDEQKAWFQYEKTGLGNDLKIIQQYKVEVAANGKNIDDKLVEKAMKASRMVNAYWKFIYGNGYGNDTGELTPQQLDQETKDRQYSEGVQWYNDAFLEIKAAHPDATDDEIKQFMTDMITRNGG